MRRFLFAASVASVLRVSAPALGADCIEWSTARDEAALSWKTTFPKQTVVDITQNGAPRVESEAGQRRPACVQELTIAAQQADGTSVVYRAVLVFRWVRARFRYELSHHRILSMRVKEVSRPAPAVPPPPTAAPERDGLDSTWEDIKAFIRRYVQLEFYGFARLDMHWSDSLLNDPRAPMWAISEGNNSFTLGMDRLQTNVNDATFVVHPRLSRFGFLVRTATISELFGARIETRMETDFYGPGSQSRPLIRMRHFYGKIDWDIFYVMFGQTSDLASPRFPSVNWEALMWNAGNLGDRQPQVQIGYVQKYGDYFGLSAKVAVGQEGARTNADIDQDGIADGDTSGQPQVQGRLGIRIFHWVDQPIEIGGWVIRGQQDVVLLSPLPANFSERSSFETFGYGIDVSIPLASFLALHGEAWQGKNLADLRGGAGHVIDTRSGRQIRSRGGWAEMVINIVDVWKIALGASVDDPTDEDVPQLNQRTMNRVLWVGNALRLDAFTIGVDYTHWHTDWTRQNPGVANRISAYLMASY